MAGQVTQEIMNDEKSRKAAAASALRAQEAERLRMQEAEAVAPTAPDNYDYAYDA